MKEKLLKLAMEIRRKGYKQTEVARKAKIRSEARLSRILRGHDPITNKELKALCEFLEISEKEL